MWLPMLKKTQLSLNVKKCDVIISLSVQYPSRQWTPHIFSSSSQHNYRSSATDGHMVQHPPCWKVLYMLGHKLKQRKSLTGWNLFDLEAFTFLCPPPNGTTYPPGGQKMSFCCKRPIFTSALKVVKKIDFITITDLMLATHLYQTSWNPRIKIIIVTWNVHTTISEILCALKTDTINQERLSLNLRWPNCKVQRRQNT